jgi:hypothetical protein
VPLSASEPSGNAKQPLMANEPLPALPDNERYVN